MTSYHTAGSKENGLILQPNDTWSFVTREFAVVPSVHARRGLQKVAEQYWWTAGIPAIALCAMGISDWRWAVVAMAIIFVVTPMAAMAVWISLLSKPEAVNDLHPHTFEYSQETGISVRWDNNRIAPLNIPAEAITAVQIAGRHIIVTCHISAGEKHMSEIIVPLSAFGSRQEAFDAATAMNPVIPSQTSGTM